MKSAHIPVLVDDEHRTGACAPNVITEASGNRHGQAEPCLRERCRLCGGPGRTGDLEPRQRQRKGRQPVAALHPEFALEFGHEVVADRQLQIFLQRHALAAQCPRWLNILIAVENQLDLPGVEFHARFETSIRSRSAAPEVSSPSPEAAPSGRGTEQVRPKRSPHRPPRPAERIGHRKLKIIIRILRTRR